MISENMIIIIPAVIAVSVFVGALIKSRKYRGIPEPQIITEEKVVKERNRKLNILLMVIYITLTLVIAIPNQLKFLITVTFTEWGREWARLNPQLTWDMTLQSSGAIIMALFVSFLSWAFMTWAYYNVMGGRSLIDRLRERRRSK